MRAEVKRAHRRKPVDQQAPDYATLPAWLYAGRRAIPVHAAVKGVIIRPLGEMEAPSALDNSAWARKWRREHAEDAPLRFGKLSR